MQLQIQAIHEPEWLELIFGQFAGNTVFSGFVLRGRPKNDRLVDGFKANCFSSEAVRMQIIAKASYTTRALTNGRVLAEVVLRHPQTADEQVSISGVLSDMDAGVHDIYGPVLYNSIPYYR